MMNHKNEPQSLPFQIRRCANLLHRGKHAAFDPTRPRDHAPGQGFLLSILMQEDGVSQKELVERMDIRPSSLGELVDKLERQGCVERRPDETDRRVTRVFLTEQGRAFSADIATRRRERHEQMFAGLSEEEQAQLLALLQKLGDSMQEQLGDACCEHDGHGGHGHHGRGRGHCDERKA